MEKIALALETFNIPIAGTKILAVNANRNRRYLMFFVRQGEWVFLRPHTASPAPIRLAHWQIWEPRYGLTNDIYIESVYPSTIVTVGYEINVPL